MPHIGSKRKVFPPLQLNPAIITLTEAIDWLQVSRTTLYRIIHKGILPCFRIGKVYRFSVDELGQWLAEQENKRRILS